MDLHYSLRDGERFGITRATPLFCWVAHRQLDLTILCPYVSEISDYFKFLGPQNVAVDLFIHPSMVVDLQHTYPCIFILHIAGLSLPAFFRGSTGYAVKVAYSCHTNIEAMSNVATALHSHI